MTINSVADKDGVAGVADRVVIFDTTSGTAALERVQAVPAPPE